MTCEVAVANRLGIALAADSAATFTQTDSNTRTYATGANKIFQLTELDPIGCMIFNNSTLAGIPWELLIKAFRSQKTSTEPAVQSYADDFVDFVRGTRSHGLLAESVRTRSTQFAVLAAFEFAARNCRQELERLRREFKEGSPPIDPRAMVNGFIQIVESNAIPAPLSAADIDTLLATYSAELTPQAVTQWSALHPADAQSAPPITEFIELVIKTLVHMPFAVLLNSYTGLVFAGYGSEQFLPSCISIKVFGFVAGKLLVTPSESFTVDHVGRDCHIQPFATRSMVETFMLGASENVYGYVQRRFIEAAGQLGTAIVAASGGKMEQASIDAHVAQQVQPFMKGWIEDTSKAHLIPLLSVVGGLSLEELAELADTLVMLESLKEKVTYRTQSVGGPIDVAVITKADGLVWIKRKLYFDASLNHRYFARVERKHRGEQ